MKLETESRRSREVPSMGSGHSGVAVVITTTKSEQTADSSSSVSVMSLMTRSSHFCWTAGSDESAFPPNPGIVVVAGRTTIPLEFRGIRRN